MIQRIKLQLILALFWFVTAYLAMSAIVPEIWAWRCAWLNLVIGLLGLLIVTRTDGGDRLFYRGLQPGEPGRWQVGVLWAIPMVILFLAGLWWLARLLGLYDW